MLPIPADMLIIIDLQCTVILLLGLRPLHTCAIHACSSLRIKYFARVGLRGLVLYDASV